MVNKDIKQRRVGRHLSNAEVKQMLTDNALNYTPKPLEPLITRIEGRIIEMYQANKIKPEEIIQSLAVLLGTAIKASGESSATIEGKNNSITITIAEKSE